MDSITKRHMFINELQLILGTDAQWSTWCTSRHEWIIEALEVPLRNDVSLLMKLIRQDPEFFPNMYALIFSSILSTWKLNL